MSKLIIDATNGTILDMSDCYIVDAELLGDDIVLSDREVQDIANEHGISVAEMARDTGFGDNKYRYTVSYSPLSLRDEADMSIEGGLYDETDGDVFKALMWAKDAPLEELKVVSETIMAQDSVWDGFRENTVEALLFAYKAREKK